MKKRFNSNPAKWFKVCEYCGNKILFVKNMQTGNQVPVNYYEISPVERESRRNGIPIPYESGIHKRHNCKINNQGV